MGSSDHEHEHDLTALTHQVNPQFNLRLASCSMPAQASPQRLKALSDLGGF